MAAGMVLLLLGILCCFSSSIGGTGKQGTPVVANEDVSQVDDVERANYGRTQTTLNQNAIGILP